MSFFHLGSEKVLGRASTVASVLVVIASSTACSDPGAENLALLQEPAQCGATWDGQDVEDYDGTLGVTPSFVELHEKPVGKASMGCSGRLVTRNLFLSAGHCNYTTSTTVTFNYQIDPTTNTARGGETFDVVEVVAQADTATHDYALVRLSSAPGDRYDYTRIDDRNPSGSEVLTLIGHPNGDPKVISSGPETGSSALGANWFGHQADTLSGTGTGVLDSNGLLIGVDTDGGCSTSAPIGENNAFRATALLDAVATLDDLHTDHLWWGASNGDFTNEDINGLSSKYHPFSGDFDGDGDTDLFLYGYGSAVDKIWWANGLGGFTSTTTTQNGHYVPVVGNFDGANGDDIFWYAPGTEWDNIWYANGDGTFDDIEWRDAADEYARPIVGDFDGDHDDDIFWYGPGSEPDSIWWFQPELPNRAFTIQYNTTVNGTYIPIAGDFDGDGDDDIFWYAPGSASDRIYWASTTAPDFTSFTSESKTINGYYTPFAGDFDGDGVDDIFWYRAGSGSDSIYWGSTGRTFTSEPQTVNGEYWPLVGDFDEDGVEDIFWYGY